MNLKRVVAKFSDSEFTDAFGFVKFWGNVDPFRDATRSSSNTERRVLSTVPEVAIPSRRVIITNGVYYVVANAEHDHYRGELVRTKYTVLPVTGVFSVRSLSQVVHGQAGVIDIHGAVESASFLSDRQDMSNVVVKTAFVFSSSETISIDSLVSNGGVLYKTISDTVIDGVGFGSVELLSLGNSAIKSITVVCKTGRDLVQETDTSVTFNSVVSLCALSELFFKFSSADRKAIEPGDVSYWLPKSVVTSSPVEGSSVDGRKVVAFKESPTGVWEVRTRI